MATDVQNPRLKNYERDLEKHLRQLLVQLEDQIRKQDVSQRDYRYKNQRLRDEEPPVRREIKRLERECDDHEKNHSQHDTQQFNDRRAQKTAAQELEDAREELQNEIQHERAQRSELDELNHKLHAVRLQLDSVAWPEKNDVKLMKNMVGKAQSNMSALEREKRIQDAYMERLRKDVEMAESELEQLAVTAKSLQHERTTERGEFRKLKDKLATFESGTMQLEDHFSKLMGNLKNDRNRVRLLDRRREELTKGIRGHSTKSELLMQTNQRAAALTQRIARLTEIRERQENRIMKREAANQRLRNANHAQERTTPELNAKLAEAEKLRDRLRVRSEGIEEEHQALRINKGTDFGPDDVHTVSQQYEEMEREVFRNEFKLNAYRKLAADLDELVRDREASDKLAPNLGKLGIPRSLSATIMDSKQNQSKLTKGYAKTRDSIADLTRKKVALEYKRKRMEERIEEKKKQHQRAKTACEALYRKLEELEREHLQKVEAIPPPVETNQVDEKDPETVLEQRIFSIRDRIEEVERENRTFAQKLEASQKKCMEYRGKIGDFESLKDAAERHVNELGELHSLQKQHQQQEKELWHIQKELEFAVMRRDYTVNKARTTLGTHNEIRVQRQQNNDKLREEIFRLEQQIQSSSAATATL